jgi:hypothetical protein
VTASRSSIGFGLAAVALTLGVSLLAAEVAFRFIDGYGLAPRLAVGGRKPEAPGESPKGKGSATSEAEPYVSRMATASGTDRAWFRIDPPAQPKAPIADDMQRRYDAHPGFELSSVYEWNGEYVRRTLCNPAAPQMPVFSHVDDLFLYEPPDGRPYPQFRFFRSTHYPSGLQTNAFGWRGHDVPLNKAPRTVRLAFVGASTTIDPHLNPFSYPEYIGAWLNEWARARASDVTFEVINAGREGVDAAAVSAIVEQELLPVRPDLVVDYEGGNQFWPAGFIAATLPPRPVESARRPSVLEQFSAVAVRLHSFWNRLQQGREPPKPTLQVSWPADLSERDPPLDDPRLPVDLPATLRAMDRMRAAMGAYGGTLVPSSFVWLASPGLVLDRVRDAGAYRFLNETLWPFSYAHIRRYADFQNRTFRKYATVHGLPFNDLAAVYPQDPRLFLDAVHMTPAGNKLKAWLVFQQLVPEIERRIADGRLPLADAGGRTVHPAFSQAVRLVRLADVRTGCSAHASSPSAERTPSTSDPSGSH